MKISTGVERSPFEVAGDELVEVDRIGWFKLLRDFLEAMFRSKNTAHSCSCQRMLAVNVCIFLMSIPCLVCIMVFSRPCLLRDII